MKLKFLKSQNVHSFKFYDLKFQNLLKTANSIKESCESNQQIKRIDSNHKIANQTNCLQFKNCTCSIAMLEYIFITLARSQLRGRLLFT